MSSVVNSIKSYRKNIVMQMTTKEKEDAFNRFLYESSKLNLDKDEEIKNLKKSRGGY